MSDIPQRAQVVVIGGGVIGTSIAYHLTKLGHAPTWCCSNARSSRPEPPGTRPA